MIKKRTGNPLRRGAAVLFCAALVFLSVSCLEFTPFFAKSAEKTDPAVAVLEEERDKAAAVRQQATAEYQAAKAERADLKKQKKAVDAEIAALEEEAEALRRLIVGYAEREQTLQRRVALLQNELDERSAVIRERFRLSYEGGNADVISVLFGSSGFYEFLTAFDRLSMILEKDQEQLRLCEEAGQAFLDEKARLDGLKAETERQSEALYGALQALTERQKEMESMMASLEKDVKAYQAAMTEAEKEEKAFSKRLSAKLAELAEQNSSTVSGGFVWPLPAKYTKISSPFGERIHPVTGKLQFHKGIDIPAPNKTEVYAVAGGTVIETGTNYANGRYVVLDHGGGLSTSYSHLSQILVKTGDILKAGDTLGLVGMTGWATGYHLDLSVYENGKAVDPMTYLS